MSLKESRTFSFLTIFIIYVLAFLVGAVVYRTIPDGGCHYLWRFFAADVAATVFVWIFGLVFKNVSVYDPYWSVAPPVMFTAWALMSGSFTSATLLLLAAVWYWGIRLTGNWAFTFKNLNAEDWRYAQYRDNCKPDVFQIINFFGLNMMPTMVVFGAMIPGFFVIDSTSPASFPTVIAFLICMAAPTIQWVADMQSHRFRRLNPGKVCNAGLWKHGRHPNYFGEILFWWGILFMYVNVTVAQGGALQGWCLLGAVLMTCLFCFISVPLMEKRQLQRKPDYAEYKKSTRMFI